MTNSIKPKSVLELNGKRYDSRTGRILTTQPSSLTLSDKRAAPSTEKKTTHRAQGRQVSQDTIIPRRTADRSRTLMRQAVKKPAPRPLVKSAVTKNPSGLASGVNIRPIKDASLTNHQDISRQARAASVDKSHLVSKFGAVKTKTSNSQPTLKPQITDLKVHRTPGIKSPTTKQATHISHNQPQNRQSMNRPGTARPVTTESILEQGIKNSQSHNEQLSRKQKKAIKRSSSKLGSRLALYSTSAFAILMLTGFYLYQNIPGLSIRYATAKSGINASLPSYKPSGFSMSNKIEYTPGQVTINFASNSDDRKFTITQRESTWNSEALLTSFVSAQTDKIQKFEDKGRTIYLYGENNATWVNGGVWYDINGNSQLNSDQLIRIVSSM